MLLYYPCIINVLHDHQTATLRPQNDLSSRTGKERFVRCRRTRGMRVFGNDRCGGNVAPTGGKRPDRPRPSWRKITPPPVISDPRSDIMNRLLTTTAIGLMLGLAPALAETQLPSNDNAPALEQPATSSEAMAPAAGAEPLAQTSEAPKSLSPQALPPEQSAACVARSLAVPRQAGQQRAARRQSDRRDCREREQ